MDVSCMLTKMTTTMHSIYPSHDIRRETAILSSGRFRGAPPLRSKIFSISCSFSQNLAKSYVGALPGGLAPPPTGILDPPLLRAFLLHRFSHYLAYLNSYLRKNLSYPKDCWGFYKNVQCAQKASNVNDKIPSIIQINYNLLMTSFF